MCVPIDKYLFTSKSPIVIMRLLIAQQQHFQKAGKHMTEKEVIQKNSDGYRLMKDRYTELKVIQWLLESILQISTR